MLGSSFSSTCFTDFPSTGQPFNLVAGRASWLDYGSIVTQEFNSLLLFKKGNKTISARKSDNYFNPDFTSTARQEVDFKMVI
jgi:hypothetical protein